MAEILLGEMKFDHDSLQAILNLVDRMTGKKYKDFNLFANQGQGYLKLKARCKSCKRLVRAERSWNELNWAGKLIDVFLSECDAHYSQKHKSLIISANAIGNAIHCDVCGCEAGTDAAEHRNIDLRSIWVCTKCNEAAVKHASSFSIAT